MVVIGFNLTKILVERKVLVRGEVKVNTKMNILDVKKEDIRITQGKEVLNFDFEFIVSYQGVADHTGGVADIKFEGKVLYLVDPKDTKKILDEWKKKEISPEVRLRVLNTILAKCNLKALVLEEEMGLPSHIPMPVLKEPGKEQEKEKKK